MFVILTLFFDRMGAFFQITKVLCSEKGRPGWLRDASGINP
jgi:hypothetical protein